jgi:two-component system, cell cycle response regulator
MSARILVIEDNPASLDLMVYLLEAFGYTALRARDGLQGIAVARDEKPDLILCDIQLPAADGHEVCRQLKSDIRMRSVPLLAVTAYAMVGDREKLLAEGFNGYISKPIQPQIFIEQIGPFLPRPLMPQQKMPSPEASTARPATEYKGKILVVDNSLPNLSLSRSILEPFGYEVITAESVAEALAFLRDDKPDWILSDVHMPQEDGFDFVRRVKADPENSNIPFIFISSTLWGSRERDLGLSLGAARFITRPIEPEALIAEIESCRKQ